MIVWDHCSTSSCFPMYCGCWSIVFSCLLFLLPLFLLLFLQLPQILLFHLNLSLLLLHLLDLRHPPLPLHLRYAGVLSAVGIHLADIVQGAQEPTGTGSFNYFAGGGVRLVCRNTGISMESDSVAYYNGGEYTSFIGSVRYVDSTVTMTAAFGTYYKAGERWEARDSVVLVNRTSGSTLTGPSLDYYRAVTGLRPVEEMVAVGRPTIRYFGTDSAGRREEPYLIVADRVRMRGDDQMWAAGTVMIAIAWPTPSASVSASQPTTSGVSSPAPRWPISIDANPDPGGPGERAARS